MRGGLVACLDGDEESLLKASAGLLWHGGEPRHYATDRLRIAAFVDRADGPRIESVGGQIVVSHGPAGGSLARLQRDCNRFAAIEWDGHVLRATRDPFGLAPLFYRTVGGALWLATEVGPLAALAPCRPDLEALAAMAASVPLEERTGLTGVLRVPPGSTLEAIRGPVLETTRYWDPGERGGSFGGTAADASAELRVLFGAALDRCYDRGAGLLLSGGPGSAAIAGLAGERGLPLYLVHVDCPSTPFAGDVARPRAAAGALGGELSVVDTTLERWDPAIELRAFSIPYDLSPFCLSEAAYAHLAVEGVTVALDGRRVRVVAAAGDGELDGAPPGAGTARGGEAVRRPRGLHSFSADRRSGSVPGATHRRAADADVAVLQAYFTGPVRERMWDDEVDVLRGQGRRPGRLGVGPFSSAATFELRELQAARMGIDIRHPLADRRIVEFLASLPRAHPLEPDRPDAGALLAGTLESLLPGGPSPNPSMVEYLAALREQCDPAACMATVWESGVRLPHLDYERLARDTSDGDQLLPPQFMVNLARLHAFAALA